MRRLTVDGTLRRVKYLSNPIPAEDMNYVQAANPEVAQQANQQANVGSLGDGAVPVQVSLPLQGREINFERLLALDEALEVHFKYRGLRR